MGFEGSVESFSLADVFHSLEMNHQTGTLRIRTPAGVERLIFFENGSVQALAAAAGKPLVPPEAFMARGYVSQNMLDEALTASQSLASPAIDLLVEHGGLTATQVDQVIRVQTEEEIYDLFCWDKANYEFDAGPAAQGVFVTATRGAPLALPIGALIMEAARRVDEWVRLHKLVPAFKEIYALDPAARKAIEKGEMEADPVEKRVTSMIDCTRDVDDLVEDSFLSKFEVLTALAGLMQSSLVRPASLQELAQAEQECVRRSLPRRRIKVLERIMALGGENPRVRRELAEALAREQRIDTACIHFSVLAEAELQAKHQEAAVELFRRILSISPLHVKAHEHLAAIYAKRGQKREAFVHYNTLFDSFREQNHPREARAAALAALECDAGATALRSSLIELLLADNQKDIAAQQFEIQGDQNAHSGSVRSAADSYRKAMQLAPANKVLKKKLADVMLTKEDRLARKRRTAVLIAAAVFLAAAAAALGFKEYRNAAKLAAAESEAQQWEEEAVKSASKKDYSQAEVYYERAFTAYEPATRLFSPVRGIDRQAKLEIERLSAQAAIIRKNAEKNQDENAKKAQETLDAAQESLKSKQVYEAEKLFKEVLDNKDSPAQVRQAADDGWDDAWQQIDAFEEALKRVKSTDFPSVEAEAAEKRKIIADYQGFPGFDPAAVRLPLLVESDSDGVEVLIDSRPAGTLVAGGGRETNTFRFSAVGEHRFDFKKPGFKTVTFTPTAQDPPVFALKIEREPAVTINLKPLLAPDETLSGEPALENGSFFVGTSEGALLEVREGETPLVRRYALSSGGGLNKQVDGPVFVYKSEKGEPFIVYCTNAGACIGLKAAGNSFTEAWPMLKVKDGQTALSAHPSVIQLGFLGAPVMALPADRKLLLVDCENGHLAAGSPLDFTATITSGAIGLEQQALIVAAVREPDTADPKLYGFSPQKKTVSHKWSPNLEKVIGLRSRPVLFVDKTAGPRLVVGATNGNLYLFDPTSQSAACEPVTIPGAGEFECEPLIVGKRLFAGTVQGAGFWCADLVRRQRVWGFKPAQMGGVRSQAAFLDGTIYFVTDSGHLYALDEDKGEVRCRWEYQVEGGARLISKPLISDKKLASGKRRIYIVSAEGKIIGFDE
ncbi:MAG: DUF4388 domain-containing protein [Planctomycetota bacterium]